MQTLSRDELLRRLERAEDGTTDAEVLEAVLEVLETDGLLAPMSHDNRAAAAAAPASDELGEAVVKFQRRYALPATGELDGATVEMMSRSTCGTIQQAASDSLVSDRTLDGLCPADVEVIRFAFETGTADSPGDTEFDASRTALRRLSRSGGPIWVETTPDDPDLTVLIDWTSADCGDRSMKGSTLAHAEFFGGCNIRTPSLPYPIHVDDEEHQWLVDVDATSTGFHIDSMMMHEGGHIIGLVHDSAQPAAVMFNRFSSGEVRNWLHPDELVQVQTMYDSRFVTHRMRNGTFNDVRQDAIITAGWTTTRSFTVGARPFMFLLKHASGDVHIHQLDPGGGLGRMIVDTRWTAGWTTVEFPVINGRTFQFLLKEEGVGGDGNNVHINAMNSDGTVGRRVESHRWTEGWTTASFFEVSGQTYLWLMKERGTGADGHNVHISRINSDGTVEGRVDSRRWSEGWTSAKPYTIADQTYVLLMKTNGFAGDGNNMHIRKVNSDGTIGDPVQTERWTEGWTTVEIFEDDGDHYLLIMKLAGLSGSSNTLHIHRLNNDGTVGRRTHTERLTEGWASATSFQTDSSTYVTISRPSEVNP